MLALASSFADQRLTFLTGGSCIPQCAMDAFATTTPKRRQCDVERVSTPEKSAELDLDPDKAHHRLCTRSSACARCLWVENKQRWKQEALLDPQNPAAGSWLALGVHRASQSPGIGCSVCADFRLTATRKWATFGNTGRKLTLFLIKQHGKTHAHKAALRAWLTKNVDEAFGHKTADSGHQTCSMPESFFH